MSENMIARSLINYVNTCSEQECTITHSSLNSTWTDLMETLEELRIINSIPKPNAEKIEKENNDMNGVNPGILTMCFPAIVNVETYNDCCVKVTFADGTFTKAVCGPNDQFDIDVGITICTMSLFEMSTR